MINFFLHYSGDMLALGMESEDRKEIESWHYSLYNLNALDNTYTLNWLSDSFAYSWMKVGKFEKWLKESAARRVWNKNPEIFKSIRGAVRVIRAEMAKYRAALTIENFLSKNSHLTTHQISDISHAEAGNPEDETRNFNYENFYSQSCIIPIKGFN